MGVSGTKVAKEAAEIVLADDNFASIANAVEEGRTVCDNLRKMILFILPTNGGKAGTILAAIVLGMALPILPVQILWVNMITAVTLALALVFEPTDPGVMPRPPRPPAAPIFPEDFLGRTLFVSALFGRRSLRHVPVDAGPGRVDVETARTAAVNPLVLFEAAHLLNSRFLLDAVRPRHAFAGNPLIGLAIVLVIGAQLLYTYAPFMHVLFQSAALDAETWVRIVGNAFSIYVIVEVEKALTRRAGWRVC